MHCIDGSDWPLTMEDIQRNYVRYYRAVSYFSVTEQMLQELVWVPSYCGADAHCPDGPCKNNRCTTIKRGNCIGFREGNAVCWRLGLIGSSCSQTCGADGISTAETTKTFITPLLLPSAKLTLLHPWGVSECYIPERQAFHPRREQDAEGAEFGAAWAYSVCRLACPCNLNYPDERLLSAQLHSTVTALSECVISVRARIRISVHHREPWVIERLRLR
eukprot:GEMP01062449.1.p1 GENE.GEMP01062449.1~~GEMP01062449.1.p1  ORF type:complete len:218 (+),score=35.62 GEMP01062449.1:321-974(+)